MQDWLLSIGLAVVGVLTFAGGALAFFAAWQERRWIMAAITNPDYEVIPVPREHAAEFARNNPHLLKWDDFAGAILDGTGYASCHQRIRQDAQRCAVEFAGRALFVKVRRLPCPS